MRNVDDPEAFRKSMMAKLSATCMPCEAGMHYLADAAPFYHLANKRLLVFCIPSTVLVIVCR
jgi:hypothetical protein